MNGKCYISAGRMTALVLFLISAHAAWHGPAAAAQTLGETAPQAALARVHLYFSGPEQSSLTAEARDLPNSDDPSELGKTIVQALIDGPRGNGVRTLSAAAAVRDVFITGDGTAYVDFNKKVTEDHPGGVRTEFVSIYSVVNSLVLNLDGISAVKLLIDGREADTLAGHMDLRFPYKANILLIK